ncbi:MAG: ABC transporter ATP-binding protein [Clostridia bacterium]|nr:ABC transporter ATP-binding protein [Clostridia bacterium]MDD3832087.1 ABC transporter ATP-binding protein [Clostridia bacterium]
MRNMFRGGGRQMQGYVNKPKHTKATFARILSYLKPFKVKLIIVTLFIIITAGANIAGTYMLEPIVDNALQVVNPSCDTYAYFAKMLMLMSVIYIIGSICNYIYQLLMLNISNGILRNIRFELFKNMERLPIEYFDKRTHGEIMSTYVNDVGSMRELVARALPSFIQSGCMIVGFFIAMIALNWMLLIICIVQTVANILTIKFIGTKSRVNYKKQQKALAMVNSQIEEIMEGQKVVKVFNHEARAREQFEVVNNQLRECGTKANVYATVLMPIMGNLAHIFYAIIVTLGVLMLYNATNGLFYMGPLYVSISIGGLVTFLEFSRRFSMPITNLSQQFNSIFHALAGAERVFTLLDEKAEVDDGSVTLVNADYVGDSLVESDTRTGIWAWRIREKDNSIKYVKVEGDVVIENVTFAYEKDKTVLDNISLYAFKGQKIALVGSTGAGKTTITNLLTRFYDISQGTITVDGIDIKDIAKSDLRRSLAMVLQDTHLFTGTVMENIRYGRLSATDEQCINAAKLANADFFISHLPLGYNTMLTADGDNLSQGQRQLLNIARAAVADPPILILDEATSSIDTRTEKLIEKGTDKLMQGRTVFLIAHRLSTVRNADAILVMEQGKNIERGNHQSLLAQRGKYYELYTEKAELD